MKISIACLLAFVYSIFYCSLGTSTTHNIEVNQSNIPSAFPENETNNKEDHAGDSIVSSSGERGFEPSGDSDNNDIQRSSDTDDSLPYNSENDFLEVAQNSGAVHEITSPSLDVIHTLVDTPALELQDKADELSVAPTVTDTSHSNSSLEDSFVQESNLAKDIFTTVKSLHDTGYNNTEGYNKTEELPSTTEPKINITVKTEEIPSFSEWTQKQLEEAERKKEQVNASVQNQSTNGKSNLSGKKRWKNHASPDCGAKIISANPEAVSPGAVLTPSRDEYKLNACTSRIWFVVELCEAIQAKKIDLANFELFSSSPKDFSISVSDRFTTRDWSNVGHFIAKDERNIQSFDLHPHLFSKFIKFEMHSHYGSEHYCPISLFRVYGTSEFEVLETENQVNIVDDDDDDETLDFDGESSTNLFSSATDAVISMVKKAAEVLGNKSNRSKTVELPVNKTIRECLPLVNSCTTPSHIVVCENCTDLLFGYVFELLSCKSKELGVLVNRPFIKKTLYNSNICLSFGLEWRLKRNVLPDIYKNYINAFFSPKYIAAMCNTVAINECNVVLNVSQNATIIPPNVENVTSRDSLLANEHNVSAIETSEVVSTPTQFVTPEIPVASQINPTKTLTLENINIIETSSIIEDEKSKPFVESSIEVLQNVDDVSPPIGDQVVHEVDQVDLNIVTPTDEEHVLENSESLEDSLDTLTSEINDESTSTVPITTATPPTQPQKESVFLRLSNRLKALELNMSLSGQYLEELSRRYKKQVEEMQRLLDKTILTLNEDNKKKDERAENLEQQINTLTEVVQTLIEERNSWISIIYWCIFIITVASIIFFCKRNSDTKQPTLTNETTNTDNLRRKSIGVITHKTPKKIRRPSEEALLISGTYSELLIENTAIIEKHKDKKQRKKRKPKLYKSNSVTMLTEGSFDNNNRDVSAAFDFAPKLTSSRILNQPSQHVETSYTPSAIQDIPFVLEESEHSALESLPHENKHKPKKFTVTPVQVQNHNGHKKSASIDNSKISANTSSPNGSVPDESFIELPRREKKNFIKKFFKNLSMK